MLYFPQEKICINRLDFLQKKNSLFLKSWKTKKENKKKKKKKNEKKT